MEFFSRYVIQWYATSMIITQQHIYISNDLKEIPNNLVL